MNNPYVQSEGETYEIVSVQGDEWRSHSAVTFDEKWGRFALRHDISNKVFGDTFAFCYFPTGVAKPVKNSDLFTIRCWLWTPGDGEPDGIPFKGKLFVIPYPPF